LTGGDLNRCQVSKVLAWLPGQTPDIWHAVVTGWNWDLDLAPLHWIVGQPECDKATAQFAYWQAKLGNAPDCVALAEKVASHWAEGRYSTARFSIRGQFIVDHAGPGAAAIGLTDLIDGPQEPAIDVELDEGVPRHILIECFADCGLPLPDWLKPKAPGAERFDRWWSLIMADGIGDPVERQKMYADPELLADLKRWRMFVDSEIHSRIGAIGRSMIKQGKALGDNTMVEHGEEQRNRAASYLLRMQRPFAVDEYPEHPGTPTPPRPASPPGIRPIFGRKPPIS
jgi:hypothetical protein